MDDLGDVPEAVDVENEFLTSFMAVSILGIFLTHLGNKMLNYVASG